MERLIVSFILIANLVACPLKCISGTAGNDQEIEAARSRCACCDVEPKVATATDECDLPGHSEEQEGDCPCDDCGCKNCICEGATLPEAVELPEPPHAWGAILNHLPAEDFIGRQLGGTQIRPPARLSLGCSIGRSLRIAHQSWVI